MTRSSSHLAPLAPLFSALNWAAFVGWNGVLLRLLAIFFSSAPSSSGAIFDAVRVPVFLLEGICIVEVGRILCGDLPGNLVLGVVLHAVRFTTLTQVFPHAHWTVPLILTAWCLTEIARYPMYLFPASTLARSVRMAVPLATFPLVAAAEAYGAYRVLCDRAEYISLGAKAALAVMLFVNGVLGPTMAYPALLKKGLPVFGLGGKKKKKEK